MPYSYSALELWASPEHPPDPALLPPPTCHVPARLEQGGRTLNFGLLAGELLGVEVDTAARTIEDVDSLPDSIAHVFLEDDLAVLLDTFSRVRGALAAAVDDSARPVGATGQLLALHPLVGQSDEGRLFFKSQRLDVGELRADLEQLCAFLAWASGHGLLVAKQPAAPGGGAAR